MIKLEHGLGSTVHTRHDPRRSETHGCKYMGETCAKISENHIQTKVDPAQHVSSPAVHTRHDPRRSETHGCQYMGEKCSKVSENHIQKIDGHGASPAVWATVK